MDPVQTNPTFTAKYTPEMPQGTKNKIVWIIVGVVVVGLWLWIANPMVVTLTGTGSVSVPATNATISFTLSSNDNSIQTAIATVQSKAETTRSYLKSKGVADGDIAQTQVTAVPANLVTQGATGFQATISMAAKTTHVTDISSLITNLYTIGALVVTQPVLSVENQDALAQQAFNSAMTDANSQADKIAGSNWKFIKSVSTISLVTSPTTSNSSTQDSSSTNGVFKIAKAVSVTYKMW